MALTFAAVSGLRDSVDNHRRRKVRTVTFDSSYPTGGETLNPSDFGLKVIDEVVPQGAFRKTDGSDAVLVSYDYSAKKLVAYRGDGGTPGQLAQVPDTTNLSAYSGRLTVRGY